MSSTRKGNRKKESLDIYNTPEWAVHRLVESVPELLDSSGSVVRILDTGAGDGGLLIGLAAKVLRPFVYIAVEIRHDAHIRGVWEEFQRWAEDGVLGQCQEVIVIFADILRFPATDLWRIGQVDFVVANPPYAAAQEFISWVHSYWPKALNFWLLRLNFLGSEERHAWLAAIGCKVKVIPNRPSFETRPRVVTNKKTGEKRVVTTQTDSIEYGWLTFGHGWAPGLELLALTDPKVRSEARAKKRMPQSTQDVIDAELGGLE